MKLTDELKRRLFLKGLGDERISLCFSLRKLRPTAGPNGRTEWVADVDIYLVDKDNVVMAELGQYEVKEGKSITLQDLGRAFELKL